MLVTSISPATTWPGSTTGGTASSSGTRTATMPAWMNVGVRASFMA